MSQNGKIHTIYSTCVVYVCLCVSSHDHMDTLFPLFAHCEGIHRSPPHSGPVMQRSFMFSLLLCVLPRWNVVEMTKMLMIHCIFYSTTVTSHERPAVLALGASNPEVSTRKEPVMQKAVPRHDFCTTPPFPVFGHKQHVANPTFLQSRTLRPFTPPDVPEDAINGSRADEDANLATLSPPGLNTLADIAQATVSNAFHSEYHGVLIQVLCN